MTEKELVEQFCSAKRALDAAKQAEADASAVYAKAELAIVEHLENLHASATATYEGVGRVQANRPRLYASVTQEHLPALIEHLTQEGRTDLIRTVVNPQSLSAYVGERIEDGKTIPVMISYYLKAQLKIYGGPL